jgi:hypothetical protein
MRELIYAVEGKSANLRTSATDDPGSGGACHKYHIVRAVSEGEDKPQGEVLAEIYFQNGPINVDGNGVNGVQCEDLVAIDIDRLEGFQRGPYACNDNQEALDHLRAALECLQRRTKARIARGVEGTHKV